MPSPEPTPPKPPRVRLKRPYESPEQRAEKMASVHARVVVAQAKQRARALMAFDTLMKRVGQVPKR